MSLINQMLRDLENRKSSNNAPSILQRNIQVTQLPSSKMPLMFWSILTIFAAGGSYWTYQYNGRLIKTSSIAVPKNIINKIAAPIAPFEKVLAAPNAVIGTTSKIALKLPENKITDTPSVTLSLPPLQCTPEFLSAPEIVANLSIKKITTIAKPATIKQLSLKQQADLLYLQAESHVEDPSTAYKLEQAIKLDPRHLKARLLLAKTLHNQGQINKTAELLDQSLILFPGNLQFINTRAQLFLQQNTPKNALETLQQIDLTNSSDETYLTLLAASYHQLQSFNNAAKVYQKLITVNPEKAENWLGLALSQERLGNPQYAREAYQRALNKNTLKESVVNFIKQRLTEL